MKTQGIDIFTCRCRKGSRINRETPEKDLQKRMDIKEPLLGGSSEEQRSSGSHAAAWLSVVMAEIG